MGGTKRKIPIAKIEKKDPRAVAFSKRSKGLYSKASELCLLSGANMAILATPVSSNSHVSFYAFGHSSADSVVSAFLANQRPPRPWEDLGLERERWWEDPSLAQSDDPDEIRSALDSMSTLLAKLKQRQADEVMKKEAHQNHQTLINQKSEEEVAISENNNNALLDQSSDFEDKDLDEVDLHLSDLDELDQILALISYNNNDQELELDQTCDSQGQNMCSGSQGVEDETLVVQGESDAMISQNNNDQELELDQNMFSDSEDNETLVMERDLDEDSLHFFDYVNELTSTLV